MHAIRLAYPDLPITRVREDIQTLIQNHQVVIIAGETGSGKSTQLAKMCLELGRAEKKRIGHTQPRRIAARAMADRIQQELPETLKETVSFKMRFQDVTKPHTRIKVMTDGILLNEVHFDRKLKEYDTLIIDEAHERSLNIDLILGYLKRLLPDRPDLKVIITSATINLRSFSEFFDDAPIYTIEGRTFPVDVQYCPKAEQEDFINHLVRAVDQAMAQVQGDILVFLTGEGEIHQALKALRERHYRHTELMPLYARLSLKEQRRVFQPGQGRRIILSTNVAETSITVPRIQAVIDSGFARVSRYSHRSKIQRLPIEPISQASAKQRSGRAGRLESGICIRMYDDLDFQQRPLFTDPEIQRTHLSAVLLQMALLQLGDIYLFPFMDPPDKRLIRDGLKQLERLQALDQNHKLTHLGKQMARLPLEPKLARILIQASQFHALREVLIIVSALSIQDPRLYPKEKLEAAQQVHAEYAHPRSQYLSYLQFWDHIQNLKKEQSQKQFRNHCQKHFISYTRLLEWFDVHHQLKKACERLHLKTHTQPATYEEIHKALLSGLFENIGLWDHVNKIYHGARGLKFNVPKKALKRTPSWIMAFHFVETQRVYAFCVAEIDPRDVLKVAQHACKEHPGALVWDEKSGWVKTHVRITLFGLPIVEKKPQAVQPHQALEAKHVFIREALVESVNRSYPFLTHNHEVMNQIRDLENRIRKSGFLFDEQKCETWYAQRLPEAVYAWPRLDDWLRQNDPKILEFQIEDFVDPNMLEEIRFGFPDRYSVAGASLPLVYRFNMSDEKDGIGLQIPSTQWPLVKDHDFSWGVPGQHVEKLEWVLNHLPKGVRVQLPSLRVCMDLLLLKMDTNQPFMEAFRKTVFEEYQVQIPRSVLAHIEWPLHLKFYFEVLEGHEILAQGRDIEAIQDVLRTKGVEENVQDETQYVTWPKTEMPPFVHQKLHGQTVKLYPALVDHDKNVVLEYFPKLEQATYYHAFGVTRLFLLEQAKTAQIIKKQMTGLETLKKANKTTFKNQSFIEDILWLSFYHTLVSEQPEIRDKKTFEARFNEHKGRLLARANALSKFVGKLIEQYQSLMQSQHKLQRNKGQMYPKIVEDIDMQLADLFEPSFLKKTPMKWLQRYPIYLQAIDKRIEKCLLNPQADQKGLNDLKPLIEAYQKICQNRSDEACLTYRWQLEEYRIILFAQPLKPCMPISRKKMVQWLKALM